jgi:hypothetical protein
VGHEPPFPSQGGRDPHLDEFPFPSAQGSLPVAGLPELNVRLIHLGKPLLKVPQQLRLRSRCGLCPSAMTQSLLFIMFSSVLQENFRGIMGEN